MGKFDGILLCTDLDDTLLTTDKQISNENLQAIQYFMNEGGYFTFATGRAPSGVKVVADALQPNAPMICYNGSGIYSLDEKRLLWNVALDKQAIKVLEYVDQNLPEYGIEVFTEHDIYFCKEHPAADIHRKIEKLSSNQLDYHLVRTDWLKAIILSHPEDMERLWTAMRRTPFFERYHFTQSSEHYFEILPKDVSKGSALLKLSELLGIHPSRTIAMGDNQNDIELLQAAGIGIAVANAVEELRNVADRITVDNNSNAVSAVIHSLDLGMLRF